MTVTIDRISEEEFILKYQEPDINIQSRIEFDMNVLRLINKRYNTHENEDYPPIAEYTFKTIKQKSTKITLINQYFNGETTTLKVEIGLDKNIRNNCIII